MEAITKHYLTKAAYSVNEFCSETGLGRSSVYQAMSEGRLRASKCGRRTVILASAGEDFLNSLPAARFHGNKEAA
jgi:predicted DNA-binding transcriptional regulator AlpA